MDENKTETATPATPATGGSVPAPKQKIYKTLDIAIASCLIMEKFKLLRLEPMASMHKGNKRVPQNYFYFVFEDGPSRESIVLGYVDKSLKVVPSELLDNIRRLKQQTKEVNLSESSSS
jgi:hypothetical protein